MLPPPDEYPAFYSGYIQQVTGPVVETLEKQAADFAGFINSIPAAKTGFSYAPGKWTVAEVIGHLLDTERVMAYRALCFGRDGSVAQPGFDENTFARNAPYSSRSLHSLAEDFQLLRNSNLFLFRSFGIAELSRKGIANGGLISVRALLYIMAGHVMHHCNILEERYL